MKIKYMRSLFLIVLLGITLGAMAQPGTGPGGGTPILGPPPATTGAPIDDNAILFLIVVMAYVYLKLRPDRSHSI
jgi:uncharacterized membrane protein